MGDFKIDDHTDEELGRGVRGLAKRMVEKDESAGQRDTLFICTYAQAICTLAHKMNATETSFTLEGVTRGDVQCGDWKVTFEQVSKPSD